MNLRLASAILAVLALASCKRSEDKPAPAAPLTSAGSATPAPAPAAAADPWSKPEPKKDPLPHPLFWSVEKDGKTTYFLGTMHIGVDPNTRIPDLVWQKLDAAPTFAMETDLSSANDFDPRYHGGKTLHGEIGDAYWHKLQQAIGSDAAAQLDSMRPMIAATKLETRSFPDTPAMDGVLAGHAMRGHKRIVYLEPLSVQTSILDKLMDARALKEQLDDLDWNTEHGKMMLDAYIAGDDVKIEQLSDAERVMFKKHGHTDAEYDAELDELLYRRNASWIPELEQLHQSGGGFVAVGAMHLIGKRSVLDLLAQRGYKVTRLTP